MAWVNPTTWSTGQTVTKHEFNDWNNSMAAVGDHGGWSTWQPTLNFHAGTTAQEDLMDPITVRAGRKLKVGKIGYLSWMCQWSSTQVCTAETLYFRDAKLAKVQLILPWAAETSGGETACGSAYLYAANVDDTYLMTPTVLWSTGMAFAYTYAGNSTNIPYWQQNGYVTDNTWLGHPVPGALSGGSYADAVFAGYAVYRTST